MGYLPVCERMWSKKSACVSVIVGHCAGESWRGRLVIEAGGREDDVRMCERQVNMGLGKVVV